MRLTILTIASIIITGVVLISGIALTPPVFAGTSSGAIAGEQGLLSGLSPQCVSEGDCTLCDIVGVIDNVIRLLLGVVGSIALAAFIWGGFQIMSQGTLIGGEKKEGMLQKGRKTIQGAIIGLAITFFSFVIVNLTINILVGTTQKGSAFSLADTSQLFGSDWVSICESSTTPGVE